MARLTLFCVVMCVVMALSRAQLMSSGPLSSTGGGGQMGQNRAGGGMSGMFSNPWQALMWSRFLDMNPLFAMMLGGMGGGGGGYSSMLMPFLWARNW